MKTEYIMMDDPRVTFKSTRIGKVYTLDGPTEQQAGDIVFRHIENADGRHQEPRMASVMVPLKSFNWNPADFAEIEIEDVPLLGIVLELGEHHYDIDLYLDGESIYGAFYCISSYMPSSDGFGKIHWIMLDRGKHKVRLEVSEKYNRMLDLTQTTPSHACLSGFVLSSDILFPPPLYNTWMFSQGRLPSLTRLGLGRGGDAVTAPLEEGYLQVDTVPAQDYLYLMDLYGQGSLETLGFHIDGPVVLEIIDGGVAQAEYPRDFPSWIRRVDLRSEDSMALRTVLDVVKAEGGSLTVSLVKPAKFGSRLIVRLFNPGDEDLRIRGLYMEGTLKCM